jgi:hypothetical protein
MQYQSGYLMGESWRLDPPDNAREPGGVKTEECGFTP